MEFYRLEPFVVLPLKEQTSPRHHLFFVLNSCLILVLSSIICLETYFQGVPWDHPPLACVGADVLDSLLQRPLVNNRICCCYKGPPHHLFHFPSKSFQFRKGWRVCYQAEREVKLPCWCLVGLLRLSIVTRERWARSYLCFCVFVCI